MSIDSLNKAATAAGFAMATPDDDMLDAASSAKVAEPEHRSVALVPVARPVPGDQAMSTLTGWVKSYLPAFGWRAPA
ncbi:MAG: hypothetical protein SFW09_15165 [Hyphomicrobiaceae bacterium]|nr:hypothetical protein [Hyphomicrobiaceae bacterium]